MNRKWMSVGLGAVLFLQTISASAALTAYLTVKGQKQGTLRGGSARETGATTVVSFAHDVMSPRDAASGLPTGKRMHKPISVTLEVGPSASPEWKEVATKATVLPQLTIALLTTPQPGKPATLYETVTLKNAIVTKLQEGMTDTPASSSERTNYLRLTIDYAELHTLVTHADGKTETDTWAPESP